MIPIPPILKPSSTRRVKPTGSRREEEDFVPAWNPVLGLNTDESLNKINPDWLSYVVARARVDSRNANGAPLNLKHKGLDISPHALERHGPWRRRGHELGFRLDIAWAPFEANPGTIDALNDVEQAVPIFVNRILDTSGGANPVFRVGNDNDNTWAGTYAEWLTVLAAALNAMHAMGPDIRTAVSTDRGTSHICQKAAEFKAAMIAAGVDLNRIEYFGTQPYNKSGAVPVHLKLADAAMVRAGLDIPITCTEQAWDFIHISADPPETRSSRTDLFDNSQGALDWTLWNFRAAARDGREITYFDFDLLGNADASGPSALGEIFLAQVTNYAAFVSPTPAECHANRDKGGYNESNAATRAYAIAYSNQVDSGEPSDPIAVAAGEAAAQRVMDGYLFDI